MANRWGVEGEGWRRCAVSSGDADDLDEDSSTIDEEGEWNAAYLKELSPLAGSEEQDLVRLDLRQWWTGFPGLQITAQVR